MSLYLVITVVNSSNTATDVSGHSKQAQQSQVNVMPSYKLKQVVRQPKLYRTDGRPDGLSHADTGLADPHGTHEAVQCKMKCRAESTL